MQCPSRFKEISIEHRRRPFSCYYTNSSSCVKWKGYLCFLGHDEPSQHRAEANTDLNIPFMAGREGIKGSVMLRVLSFWWPIWHSVVMDVSHQDALFSLKVEIKFQMWHYKIFMSQSYLSNLMAECKRSLICFRVFITKWPNIHYFPP